MSNTKITDIIKWLLMIAVLAIIIHFISQTNFTTLKTYLIQMPKTFIGLIFLSFTAYAISTLAWKSCMTESSKSIGFFDAFIIRHVSEMLTVFNPTSIVAGESFKGIYLQKMGYPKTQGISSIIISRLLTILSAVFLIIISMVYLMDQLINNQITVYVLLILVIILSYLLSNLFIHSNLYLARLIMSFQKLFNIRWITKSAVKSMIELNRKMHHFYHKHPFRFWGAFILSCLTWIFGALEFYIILKTLDLDISIMESISIEMGVIGFKTLGSIVPGQIGVEEYGNKIMLQTIGVASLEIWLVVSILRRARQLFWLVSGVLFYILFMRLKFKKSFSGT